MVGRNTTRKKTKRAEIFFLFFAQIKETQIAGAANPL
jgi:hypothetical protein